MRHVAVPTPEGFLSTADIEEARRVVATIDFFETVFAAEEEEQASLHQRALSALLKEVHGWEDAPPT